MRPSPLSSHPTEFARQLGATHPVIQAPMAGGITTPELVAAVSRAGALGSLAGGMLAPETLRKHITAIRSLGCQHFSVNLFVLDEPQPSAEAVRAALQRLAPHYAALGVQATAPERVCESTELQLDVLIETSVPIASFAFGLLDRARVADLHRVGTRVVGTAKPPSMRQWPGPMPVRTQCAPRALRPAGTAAGSWPTSAASNWARWRWCRRSGPRWVSRSSAAGGIMNGAGIAACLALGASAAQLGTAFLCCDEGRHPPAVEAQAAGRAGAGNRPHRGLLRPARQGPCATASWTRWRPLPGTPRPTPSRTR